MNRRSLLATALTLGLPRLSWAQSRPLTAATFSGNWEQAQRAVLIPAFRKASGDAQVVLQPMLSVEQIAKVSAARANPPIDVMQEDPGPGLEAVAAGLVEPYPVDRSAHYKDLFPAAQEPGGPAAFFQLVGLTYNPETVRTPPTSWADLWDPAYKGRVGIPNLLPTLGTSFLVEIARLHGGSESNVEPGFAALQQLKPNLATVAQSAGSFPALFKEGKIAIAPGNFNATRIMKAQGIPVEFAVPKEGVIAASATMHLVKNSPNAELAFKWIETALSPEVQTALMAPPYLVMPTNTKVRFEGELATALGIASRADVEKRLVFQDWHRINEQRAAWIERFNREMRV
jgi:putative spermidine/putrescine transport system substrate-binding protein